VLPPNLECFNYTDSDSHMSFPNTPRHSQDGSQPATPLSGGDTPRNGRVGGGTPRGRSPAPHSRASSPDREIAALGEELGVSPLVRAYVWVSVCVFVHVPRNSRGYYMKMCNVLINVEYSLNWLLCAAYVKVCDILVYFWHEGFFGVLK